MSRQACDGGKEQLRSISIVGDINKHLVGTSTIIRPYQLDYFCFVLKASKSI